LHLAIRTCTCTTGMDPKKAGHRVFRVLEAIPTTKLWSTTTTMRLILMAECVFCFIIHSRRLSIDCPHTSLDSRCGERQTWATSSRESHIAGLAELHHFTQAANSRRMFNHPGRWQGTSRLTETVTGVPALFGFCPFNECVSRANPER
jgi:hypothetical protein